MLSYTEIKIGKVVVIDGDPYEVMATSGVVKKQRQKPHNTVKMKNMRSGATVEKSFTQADKIIQADIEMRKIKFIYENRGEATFASPDNPRDRFIIAQEVLSNTLDYIRENDIVEARVFENDIIGIHLPIKVEIKVSQAPPNIRGNTSAGGNKLVELETGISVTTPLFINTGDVIRVNTETGEYVERV